MDKAHGISERRIELQMPRESIKVFFLTTSANTTA